MHHPLLSLTSSRCDCTMQRRKAKKAAGPAGGDVAADAALPSESAANGAAVSADSRDAPVQQMGSGASEAAAAPAASAGAGEARLSGGRQCSRSRSARCLRGSSRGGRVSSGYGAAVGRNRCGWFCRAVRAEWHQRLCSCCGIAGHHWRRCCRSRGTGACWCSSGGRGGRDAGRRQGSRAWHQGSASC